MAEGAMKPAVAIYERRTMKFQARQLGRPVSKMENTAVEKRVRKRCAEQLQLCGGRDGNRVEEVKHRKEEERTRGEVIILGEEAAQRRAREEEKDGEVRIFTDGSRDEEGYTGAGVAWKERCEGY